ncbi:hypothetical protein ABT009_40555 [Streptomyces sp. NPDC002896]|uniref:hypothetical protein n=1 Tax=Streptomyces sp. NPDC002896 TaxID=3154438 RepID=UPI00333351CF
MGLDAVADELYRMPPGGFTTTRDERAKVASASGDRELAEQIRRLRRPALAAWASNLWCASSQTKPSDSFALDRP